MPTHVEIAPMVELLRPEWAAIDERCPPLTEADWASPTCLPGWTVQDQLAHVAGIEMMLDGAPAPEVDVSHLEHLRNDVARMGEVWVEDMRSLSGAEVLAQFRDVTARRLAAFDEMTQRDFDAPSWTPVGKDETYGRFMRIRHYDAFLHEHDMRAAIGAPERAEPCAIASALTESVPSLGYIVGRRAALPDGSSVRIELTGPVPATYFVVVDGRAAIVDELDGEPTVSVSMPTMLWFRLTGGRTRPEEHLGSDLVLSGDPTLGRQLVDNMAVTI